MTREGKATLMMWASISQCTAVRRLWAAGFIMVLHHLSSQSMVGLRLYLFLPLSGSPVMSGDLARSMVTMSPVSAFSDWLTAPGAHSHWSTLAQAHPGATPTSLPASPRGLGRGPLGTTAGFSRAKQRKTQTCSGPVNILEHTPELVRHGLT